MYSSQLHMTVFHVLRIKQHVYGLAQTIVYKIKSQVQFPKRQRCILLCIHCRPFLWQYLLVINSDLTSFWRTSCRLHTSKLQRFVKKSSLPLCDLCARMTLLKCRKFLTFPNYWIPEFLNFLKSKPNRRPLHYNLRTLPTIYPRIEISIAGIKPGFH